MISPHGNALIPGAPFLIISDSTDSAWPAVCVRKGGILAVSRIKSMKIGEKTLYNKKTVKPLVVEELGSLTF
jgi:hypothetical protein